MGCYCVVFGKEVWRYLQYVLLRACIVWRESSTEELSVFKLNTVTYGTKPAAFWAIRAMHQLCYDEEESLFVEISMWMI